MRAQPEDAVISAVAFGGHTFVGWWVGWAAGDLIQQWCSAAGCANTTHRVTRNGYC